MLFKENMKGISFHITYQIAYTNQNGTTHLLVLNVTIQVVPVKSKKCDERHIKTPQLTAQTNASVFIGVMTGQNCP